MVKISAAPRAATIARLADPSTGYNALVAAGASDFGVASTTKVGIDFAGKFQLWQFNGVPSEIDESTPDVYPMLFYWTPASNNSHDQYGPQVFSGSSQVALSFWISVASSHAPRTMENTLDLIESALYTIFEDGNWPGQWGASGWIMTGISCQRGAVNQGDEEGEHWAQNIKFTLSFRGVA